MNRTVVAALLAPALGLSTVPSATADRSHGSQTAEQPYAGFESRSITSLSDDDIEQLRSGAGWGLALPAELNNHPGPAHLLENSDAIGLDAAQRTQVQALFDTMRADAIAAGERLIAAESALDEGFRAGDLTADDLRALLDEAVEAREALRFIHLSQHLRTVDILTEEQIARYNTVRGYADDPCAQVPEGHNATMWRLHNGCD
ncbi:MAG: hypothetical protein KI785_09750 [Devosiaceae bacterium]|nr:hypothetical protein [Devosiaceae bacterium MH13]